MKKGFFSVMIIAVLTISLCACGGDTQDEEKDLSKEPDLSQVRSICELATLECYYHNVAKSTKTKEIGFSHIGEKDRKFWIEYSGVAKIGIDMSKVNMELEGETITITMPEAKLISMEIPQFEVDNYISTEDGWNKNKITAEDQTAAIENAQNQMKATVMSNSAMFIQAQERAKKLIENYVAQLSELSEQTYHIEWKYMD